MYMYIYTHTHIHILCTYATCIIKKEKIEDEVALIVVCFGRQSMPLRMEVKLLRRVSDALIP